MILNKIYYFNKKMSLFIGNIAKEVTKKELEDLFSKYGKCEINYKGAYAFAEFSVDKEAEQAKLELNKKEVNGLKIYLQGENVILVVVVDISQETAQKEEEDQILEDVIIVKEDIEVVQEVIIIIIEGDINLLQDHQVGEAQEESIGKETIEEVGAKVEKEIGIGVGIKVEVKVIIEILEVEIKIKVKILEIMMINH